MTLRPALAVLALAALATLTGCTAAAAETSAPPASPSQATPTPSPTPTQQPQAAAVLVGTQSFSVVDENGAVLASFTYVQDTAEVVAGLSEYLGDPVDTPYEGGGDTPPATYHDWGGLRLVDDVYDGAAPHFSNHWVWLSSADAHGVALQTVDGLAVGGALSAAAPFASEPAAEWPDSRTGTTTRVFRTSVVALPPVPDDVTMPDVDPELAIDIQGTVETDTITRITAPSPNWGA